MDSDSQVILGLCLTVAAVTSVLVLVPLLNRRNKVKRFTKVGSPGEGGEGRGGGIFVTAQPDGSGHDDCFVDVPNPSPPPPLPPFLPCLLPSRPAHHNKSSACLHSRLACLSSQSTLHLLSPPSCWRYDDGVRHVNKQQQQSVARLRISIEMDQTHDAHDMSQLSTFA